MAVLAILFSAATAQTVKKDNSGNYVSVSTVNKSADKKTGEFFVTSKGEKFPIYVSSTGKYYVIRVSKNTGKEYKQYLKLEN